MLQGSIINYRAIFLQDPITVTYRCKRFSKILELHVSSIEDIQDNHPELEKNLLVFHHQILKTMNLFHLDYIKAVQANSERPKPTIEREMILKNVVFQIIEEKRRLKNRPKLHDFLACFRKFGEKKQDALVKQMHKLYNS